ncbi:MAG: helix-turn-helix domain-containing protein [Chitinophagaceae bacterium]
MQNSSFFIHCSGKPVEVNSLKELNATNAVEYLSQERLSRFEIIWLQEGSWTIQVNGHPLQLTTHTAYFLMPGQLRFAAIADEVKGFHISIAEEYFHLTTNQQHALCHYNFPDQPWCSKPDKSKAALLELILSVIQRECTGETLKRQGIILGWLKILLEYFDWNYTCDGRELTTRRDQQISKQFFKLLADGFKTQKKVSHYAGLLAITPAHLNQVVKKISGYPASYHIQRCIISEAKRQALHGGKSMKEISYALGFDDVSHFSKFFKNNAGMSFSGFKRSVHKDQCR